MMKKLILFIAVGLHVVGSADASLITYNVGGVITNVDSRITSVEIGDTWSAEFSIESTTLDSDMFAFTGLYRNPVGSYSVGGVQFSSSSNFASATVAVVNTTHDAFAYDLRSDAGSIDSIDGYSLRFIRTILQDTSGTVFENDFLTNSIGLNLSNFDSNLFIAQTFDGNNIFTALRGDITSYSATVVPIPAAVWLFGSSVLGLLMFRRKEC